MRNPWLAIGAFGALSLSAPLAAAPADASARAAPSPNAVTGAMTVKPKSPSDPAAMLAFVDKLFPPQPDPDPVRLALARTSVAAMWPEGSYGKMMTGFMGGMVDRVMQMKASDLAALGGKGNKPEQATGSDLSLRERAAAKDPYFDARMGAYRQVMTGEMGKVSAVLDPRIRDGLSRSMARRFDARQLTDINAFFATPSGHALADQYMQLWFDPDLVRSLFGSFPEMMKLMPEMMQKLKAVDEKFPKPPKAPAQAAPKA